MKITMRRDTWTALLAAVVRVRPSGSVGPRSDRTGVERWRPAAWTERGGRRGEEGVARGGEEKGERDGRPEEGQLLPGLLRDPGLPGSAGGSPGGNTRTIL